MDVRLYDTVDGGEIDYKNGQALLADGLETAAYLSLFGGNEDDSGAERDDAKQWWGNFSETEEARQLRSQTQHVIKSLPLTSGNLVKVEDAALADLDWMRSELSAGVVASASVTAPRMLNLEIEITVGDSSYPFTFSTPWNAGT